MDINEKIKQRTQDDSDNEDEGGIVWGSQGRSRYSKESQSDLNKNNNQSLSEKLNNNESEQPQLKKKKI